MDSPVIYLWHPAYMSAASETDESEFPLGFMKS
jgi:hypothetical protein